nr:MAG TPA: hypothetical protein [Caudoviricetes sp.]
MSAKWKNLQVNNYIHSHTKNLLKHLGDWPKFEKFLLRVVVDTKYSQLQRHWVAKSLNYLLTIF